MQKKDIIFIERSGRSTTIYTKSGPIKTYLTLNELEGELENGILFVPIVLSLLISITF